MNFDEERLEAHCRDLERHIGLLIAENEQLHARVRALILSGARGLVAEAFAAGAAKEREALKRIVEAFLHALTEGEELLPARMRRTVPLLYDAIRARGEAPKCKHTHLNPTTPTMTCALCGYVFPALKCLPPDDAKEKALAALRAIEPFLPTLDDGPVRFSAHAQAAAQVREAIAALEGKKTKAANSDEGEDP